jgi:hypothetical protein
LVLGFPVIGRLLVPGMVVGLVVSWAPPAAAQGLLDFLFGARRMGPPPSASSYADPYPSFGGADQERRPAPSGASAAFCVRLCDGRYFPIQRTNSSNAAHLCNSVCPAAQTKIFSGAGIDHAVASDGSRYANLTNAFAYRERIVENCTCNGRDAHGLVTMSVSNDPTLRSGDIVATNDGFVAYSGNGRTAAFTPIQSFPGLSMEWRERLAQTRIIPAASPVPPEALRTGPMGDRNRRVQLDR